MKRTWIALLLFFISGTLASCSVTNMTPRIAVYRVGDTLQVDLDEETSARWSATRDSLVINCENCEVGYTRMVEKFEQDDRSAVYISPYERLRLSLFSNGLDTIIIVEPLLIADTLTKQEPRRIVRAAPRRRATTTPPKRVAEKPETPPKNNNVVKKEEKVVKKEEAAPKKRATTARVSAAEGVAVYKDKSKREVLKILPKGSAVPYIAKEGSLTSVMVDGQEGFVESEAVKIED